MTAYSTDVSRRDFLKAGAGLLGLTFAGMAGLGASAGPLKKLPPLSFSTLGCPDWTFPAIMDFAVKNGYSGIEVRGIQRQMDLVKCPEFSNPANIAATLQQMKEHGLKFVDLGSSAELHHADAAARKDHLDHARRFIDLAQQLHCPYVRVFPNKLPKDQDRQATIELGEERIKVRHGNAWLELDRRGAEISWRRENGQNGVLQLTESGRLFCDNTEEEMDMVAEAWARELMHEQ